MDLFSSSMTATSLSNSNWTRLFQRILTDELHHLSDLNLTINNDTIDSNEFNIRFQIGSDLFRPFTLNTSTIWEHFIPLEYEGTNFNEVNFIFEVGSTIGDNISTGLTKKQLIEHSEKILIKVNTECYICLDILLPNSCMRQLKICQHKFCIDCIDKWLENNKTCPICKRNLLYSI